MPKTLVVSLYYSNDKKLKLRSHMRKLVAGNWKLNCNIAYFDQFRKYVFDNFKNVDAVIAVPYVYISIAKKIFPPYISVAAQDTSRYKEGAYTGEVSAEMLKETGADYVVIGHSERRTLFSEDDKCIAEKVERASLSDLKIILCIGENEETRKKEVYLDFLKSQLEKAVSKTSSRSLDIAYEPIWAIGTGISAETSQIQEVTEKIRQWMTELKIEGRILYGGSVDEKVSEDLAAIVDGVLVGNASLTEEFQKIANAFSSQKIN